MVDPAFLPVVATTLSLIEDALRGRRARERQLRDYIQSLNKTRSSLNTDKPPDDATLMAVLFLAVLEVRKGSKILQYTKEFSEGKDALQPVILIDKD
jgi:hypothetical protein